MHSFHSNMYIKLVEAIKLIKMFSIRAPSKEIHRKILFEYLTLLTRYTNICNHRWKKVG